MLPHLILLALQHQAPSTRQLATNLSELQEQLQSQEQAISELAGSQQLTDKAVEQLSTVMEISNSSIGNALSATNTFIAIAALIVAVAAIVLGVYVYKMERKIKDMKDAVSKKEEEVKKLTDQINNDINGLFDRIRREDTKAYLKRLEEVPRDICNIGDILSTRQLLDEDYQKLKNAYLKIKINDEDKLEDGLFGTYGDWYKTLLFEHFPGRSIKDPDIREDIVDFFETGVGEAFLNDIEKEVKEIGEVLSDKTALKNREVILLKLRKAISTSEFNNNTQILDCLKDSLNDSDLWETVDKKFKEEKHG